MTFNDISALLAIKLIRRKQENQIPEFVPFHVLPVVLECILNDNCGPLYSQFPTKWMDYT